MSGALVVVQLVTFASKQPWWPGWDTIRNWLVDWNLVLIAALLAGAAILLRRRGQQSAATPPTRVRWVDGPDQLSFVARLAESRAPSEQASRPRWNWTATTSVITAITAIGALVFTALSLTATEQGQITDRYTKAIDQIGTAGDEHLETRLGGIYALERLAHDSPRDQPTIIEVLSAFIRGNTHHITNPLGQAACSSPAAITLDVQAALTVLGRRDTNHDSGSRVDLHEACMPGADLAKAKLANAYFYGADLTGADLYDADLLGASFTGADLTGAYLVDANLANADFYGADLTKATLGGANLTKATLTNANLTNAGLGDANLTGAALGDANLTRANLNGANLTGAYLLRATLGGAYLTARHSPRRTSSTRTSPAPYMTPAP